LGAAYGPRDVTGTLNNRITYYQSLSVQASNSIFGDPWRGFRKSLVVVYQQKGYDPSIAIVQEHHTVNIYARPELSHQPEPYRPWWQLRIVGAAYGLADVTGKVRSLVNYQHLNVVASNSVFGDPWRGFRKTLVVVYQHGNGPYKTKIVTEHNRLII
jgi:hypothetical protein